MPNIELRLTWINQMVGYAGGMIFGGAVRDYASGAVGFNDVDVIFEQPSDINSFLDELQYALFTQFPDHRISNLFIVPIHNQEYAHHTRHMATISFRHATKGSYKVDVVTLDPNFVNGNREFLSVDRFPINSWDITANKLWLDASMNVVGEASDISDAQNKVIRLNPDIRFADLTSRIRDKLMTLHVFKGWSFADDLLQVFIMSPRRVAEDLPFE